MGLWTKSVSPFRIAAGKACGPRLLAVCLAALLLAATGCKLDRQRAACGYACLDDCVGYPDPMCYGYYPTCWQPWPAECPECPVIVPEIEPTGADQTFETVPVPPVGPPPVPADGQPFPALPGSRPPRLSDEPDDASGEESPSDPQGGLPRAFDTPFTGSSRSGEIHRLERAYLPHNGFDP